MAQKKDWTLRTLYACSVLAFAGALSLLLQFWDQVMPAALRPSWMTALLRERDTLGFPIVTLLILLALALCLLARLQAVNNTAAWSSAGCPQCHKDSLVRVRRRGRDRILALSGIPLGRYRCWRCRWVGRRIRMDPIHNKIRSGRSDMSAMVSPRVNRSGAAAKPAPLNGKPPASLTATQELRDAAAGEVSAADVVWNRTNGTFSSPEAFDADENANVETAGQIVGSLPVKLREEPIPGSRELAILAPGTALVLLASPDGKEVRSWRYVQVDDLQGWIMSMFLEKVSSERWAVDGGQ